MFRALQYVTLAGWDDDVCDGPPYKKRLPHDVVGQSAFFPHGNRQLTHPSRRVSAVLTI